jgi:hypothetical protein
VHGKSSSLQQRQWYLFQRAAWAEAQRQVAEGSETSNAGNSEGDLKRDSTGQVQRLIASWWREYKNEVTSEGSQNKHSDAAVSARKGTKATAFMQPTKSSTIEGTESKLWTETEGRQNATECVGASSSAAAQAGTNHSDVDSSSNKKGRTGTSTSGGAVSSRCCSTGEAELYARTAHHVWKRFGARPCEAVTNEEARALYRAWR